MRILLVEDDPLVSDAIVRGLATAGYVVDAVTDAESVQSRLDTTHYDLAIVDLGLPGEDGFTLVRRLRREGSSLPLLIVTARDGLDDRVNALDLGADDYLVKPFALPELAARCRALIRRATAARGRVNPVGIGWPSGRVAGGVVPRRGRPLQEKLSVVSC